MAIDICQALSVARLAWAKRSGCPWDERTCASAAVNGQLAVVQWAREQADPPCPWNERTCAGAALGGHLAGGVRVHSLNNAPYQPRNLETRCVLGAYSYLR